MVIGGGYDKSKGYFIDSTVIVAKKPDYETMSEELFGPVLTVYVYDDKKWKETLEMVDTTSIYALTGSIIAQDRYAIHEVTYALRNAAGYFYINDKCTGAVVGQQPFGGARGSGTNDKQALQSIYFAGCLHGLSKRHLPRIQITAIRSYQTKINKQIVQ